MPNGRHGKVLILNRAKGKYGPQGHLLNIKVTIGEQDRQEPLVREYHLEFGRAAEVLLTNKEIFIEITAVGNRLRYMKRAKWGTLHGIGNRTICLYIVESHVLYGLDIRLRDPKSFHDEL